MTTKMNVKKLKKINTTIENNNRENLSIQFSLDGFSFCVSNILTKEIQDLKFYNFDNTIETPELLLTKIETLVKENSILNQSFETISIIHQNPLATLVPNALFDENKLPLYLKYNIKTFPTDYIAFDDITHSDIKNVYIPYININNFFFQKFGEFEYKHHATVLIDKLILHSKNNNNRQFYVHVSRQYIDIVVIKNAKLQFYNSFRFSTKEDFLYYILFTSEQLQLNPEEFLLTFSGEITPTSELHKITYQYVRNIEFLELESSFFTEHKNITSYSNFIITP